MIYSRIVNRAGNPYGCPIKYLDVLGSNVSPTEDGVSLEREMPVGSKISVTAKQVDSPFVNYLALQVILLSSYRNFYLMSWVNTTEINL